MARAAGFYLCFLIVIIDVVAGILGIVANNTQNKENINLSIFECGERGYRVYKLGLAAAILLGLAHVLANLLGCYACISQNGKISVTCLILTWFAFGVGLLKLIVGTLSNNMSRVSCSLLQQHLLLGGGITCFLHCLVSVGYYAPATSP